MCGFPDGGREKFKIRFSRFQILRIMSIRQKKEELHPSNSSLKNYFYRSPAKSLDGSSDEAENAVQTAARRHNPSVRANPKPSFSHGNVSGTLTAPNAPVDETPIEHQAAIVPSAKLTKHETSASKSDSAKIIRTVWNRVREMERNSPISQRRVLTDATIVLTTAMELIIKIINGIFAIASITESARELRNALRDSIVDTFAKPLEERIVELSFSPLATRNSPLSAAICVMA